jgi:hypothetical protein
MDVDLVGGAQPSIGKADASFAAAVAEKSEALAPVAAAETAATTETETEDAASEVEETEVSTESGNEFSTQKLKFLTCGTLGLDVTEEEMPVADNYYKVGQYVKAAASVAAMVALLA